MNKQNSRFKSRANAAFSLVEMVATMAVLGLMGIFIVQTVDVVNKTTARSEGMLDTSSEARMVLDRIGLDLAGMFIRRDMDYVFQNYEPPDSADIMRFYSEVFSDSGNNNVDATFVRLSLVGYRVTTDGTGTDGKLALFRGVKGYTYLDNNFMGLQFETETDPITNITSELINVKQIDSLTNGDYDILSPNVIRLDLAIIDGSGTLRSAIPQANLHGGNRTSADIEDAKYLIVGIALIGPDDRMRLTADQLEDIAGELPNVSPGQTPFDAWKDFIDGSRSFTDIPPLIANNVRYYQRAYPLSDR